MQTNKHGYVDNIERVTLENETFRTVLYTGQYLQLVVMSVAAGDEIGTEVHGQDQFLRVEAGTGQATISGATHVLSDGVAVVVPAGTEHNIVNTGTKPLKLYSIYAAPHHRDGVIHATKADADADEDEEFLGDTSE